MGIISASPLRLTRLTTLVWVVLLIFLATLPRQPYVPGLSTGSSSTLAHFGTHAMLAALVYLSLAQSRGLLWRGLAAGSSFLVSALLAFTLEGLQFLLPDRSAQLFDLAVSVAGAGVGATLVFTFDYLGIGRKLMSVGAFGVVLLSLIFAATSLAIWDTQLPRVGDHWHASYSIRICGRPIAPLPATFGNVHTHGDSLVHIHPQSASEAGTNANLALFLATSGGRLTDTSLTLPSGERFENGDRCPDGQSGELSVVVNGETLEKPSTYVFQDRDWVLIEFRAVGDSL